MSVSLRCVGQSGETLYGALINDFADGLLGCMATNLVVGERS